MRHLADIHVVIAVDEEVTQTYLTGAGQWQPGCHSLQKFTRRA